MQQALEALMMMRDKCEEYACPEYACPACNHADAAITTLRKALAEPEQHDTDCHAQGICQRSGYSIAPTPRINELEAELSEQARVNGMGGEREARLMAELERKSDAIQRLWKERDELRTLNAELVEALQRYHRIVIANAIDLDCDAAIDKAHAALAKAEASK